VVGGSEPKSAYPTGWLRQVERLLAAGRKRRALRLLDDVVEKHKDTSDADVFREACRLRGLAGLGGAD
jgi:hypothetical protein